MEMIIIKTSFVLPINMKKEEQGFILDFCDFINRVFKNCDFKIVDKKLIIYFLTTQEKYNQHKQGLFTCYSLFNQEGKFKDMEMSVLKYSPSVIKTGV